jgi:arsenate reductase (thioredoxin)
VSEQPYNVLFLCTGNSARSILAEVMLNHLSQGKFMAYSAGSHPRGSVHPFTLDTLQRLHLPIAGLRSKSWEEFAQPGAPQLDFVFTVCDDAAGEVCPLWPGKPMTAHWGVPDPAAFQGTDAEKRALFRQVTLMLRRRIELFINLPLAQLDTMTLQARLKDIGQHER